MRSTTRGALVLAVMAAFAGASGAAPAAGQDSAKDTDLDGLPDIWETNGVDTDGDGRIDLDLPRFGADPLHRDVFVEIDSMRGHAIDHAAIKTVVESFRRAPVPNPDGERGVNLHVDNGAFSVMNPETGERWGRRSQATNGLAHTNGVPHQDVLGTFDSSGRYDWAAFDAIKRDNFSAARRPAFRYALSIHQYGSATNFSSGLARGIPGTDFFVSLGRVCDGVDCTFGTVGSLAGTFMHELGHTLGLLHGGHQEINYKPNYVSVMNYFWQFSGVRRRPTGLGVFNPFETGRIDYSRTGPTSFEGTLGVIDENALREGPGLSATGSANNFFSARLCRFRDQQRIERYNRAIDWNCNNQIVDVAFSQDITGDGRLDRLEPFHDWGIFASRIPGVGPTATAGLRPDLRRTPNFDRDATVSRLQDAAQAALGDERRPLLEVRQAATSDGRVQVTFTARDTGALDKLTVIAGDRSATELAGSFERRTTLEASITVRPGERVSAIVFDRATNNRALTVRAR